MFQARKENEMLLKTGSRRCPGRAALAAFGALRVRTARRGRCPRRAIPVVLFAVSMLVGMPARQAHAAAAVTVSEATLHFGSQQVGTTSSARSVTVTNHGPGTLNISGASLIGADAGDFTIAAGAGGAALPEHGLHTI